MNFVAKILRILSVVWLVLASLLILLLIVFGWYSKGFWAVQEMLNPVNFRNYLFVAIIVAPGFFLSKLADAVQTKRWASALGVGIALPVSLGVLVLAFYLTRINSREAQQENKKTHEYKVSSVRVVNGSATMYADTNYYVTFRRGPVGTEGIPELVKLGDKVTVKDRSLTVNHILVTEILEDMSYGGKIFARKGDIRCLLLERLEDRPGDDDNSNRNRLWINITDCKPQSPLQSDR